MSKQVEFIVRFKPNHGWTTSEYIDGELMGSLHEGYTELRADSLSAVERRRKVLEREGYKVTAIQRGPDIPSYC
jgi:hypothetical protein